VVISFVAVLVKAYFDGEFRSVAALQKYIGNTAPLDRVSDGFSGNSSCYSCLTRLSWMCGRFGDVRSCCWVLVVCNYTIGSAAVPLLHSSWQEKYGMPLLMICSHQVDITNGQSGHPKSKSYPGFFIYGNAAAFVPR
jgi:hypothetical protein